MLAVTNYLLNLENKCIGFHLSEFSSPCAVSWSLHWEFQSKREVRIRLWTTWVEGSVLGRGVLNNLQSRGRNIIIQIKVFLVAEKVQGHFKAIIGPWAILQLTKPCVTFLIFSVGYLINSWRNPHNITTMVYNSQRVLVFLWGGNEAAANRCWKLLYM